MIPNTKNIVKNASEQIFQSGFITDDVVKISEIYQNKFNISIWRRNLNDLLIKSSQYVLENNPNLEYSQVLQPDEVKKSIRCAVGANTETSAFIEDVSYLSYMFCKLFDYR